MCALSMTLDSCILGARMLSSILRKLWHSLLILCISFIIVFAIAISAMRMLLPKLQHHAYLERVTSKLLKTSVHIGHVDTNWYGLQPRIILHHVALLDTHSGRQKLAINRLVVRVNLLSSLVHWQLLPSQLTIDGATLAVGRSAQGQYFVKGLMSQSQTSTSTQLKTVVGWLLTQSNINLLHIRVNFLQKLQLNNITLHLQNDFFEHHLYGAFQLAGEKHTQVKLIADLVDGDDSLAHISGNVYLSVKRFSNTTFNVLRPLLSQFKTYQLQHLSGGAKLWLGLSSSRITSLLAYYALGNLQTTKLSVHNAVGKVSWSNVHHQNYFHLENQQARIFMPTVFSRPIQLGSIILNANYRKDKAGWQLTVPKLNLVNHVLAINGQLQLTKHKDGPPLIDVISGFKVNHLSGLTDYIPTGLLKPHLAAWFKQAFLGGYLRHGTVLYRGPLMQHTLRQHHAQFQLSAQLHQLKFSYAPHWPLATEGEVAVVINKNLLSFTSNHIKSAGNIIDQLKGQVPLQPHCALTLSLHENSDLSDGWNYIERTPLPLALKLKHLKFSGPMNLNFKLKFPLHGKPHHDVHTQGLIKVSNGSLVMSKWGLSFNMINGTLAFHNKQLFDKGAPLHALLFANPIQIHVKTVVEGNSRTTEFNSSGLLSSLGLRNHFPLPLGQFFTGSSKFAADLALHNLAARGDDLHITTDLVGVRSHGLPPPFNKKATDNRPLKIDVNMRSKKPLYLKVRYAGLAAAALIYDRAEKGLLFRSGDIELGGKAAHFIAQPGLVISGALAELNWDPWQQFLDEILKSQQAVADPKKVVLRSLSLQVKQLDAYHHRLHNIHLALTPLRNAWHVGLLNKQVDGFITIPQDHKKLWTLQFKRLQLPNLKTSHGTTISPLSLPPLQIQVDNFSLGDQYYGHIIIQTQPLKNGLAIKQLSCSNTHYNISVNGNWTQVGTKQYTALLGGLHTDNLGVFLHHWKKSRILGGQGKLGFSLQWAGSPIAIRWGALTGTVSFDFKNGSLVALDSKTEAEIGLGRLLNLLSVDQIVKRLETHFRDLTQKGLWFDHFKGVWVLHQGVATTNNTHFDGPIAKIAAVGKLDLGQHQADMTLDVTPQLTSSLPVVVGIFGGPIAGAATWLVNKIIGPHINRLSESSYGVTGPWKHLKISKLKSG